MIGRKAGHELIEQSRTKVGIQASNKARARTNEIGVDVVETLAAVAPQGIGDNSGPGIVDVAEGQALIIRKIVINADQFFAPSCRGGDGAGDGGKTTAGGVGGGN